MLKHFFKRTAVALAMIFLIIVYLCAGAVSLSLPNLNAQTVYFLVDSTDSVAASAEMISLRGGAGYVTSSGEVAFNVYFSRSEAEEIYKNLLGEYPNVELRTYVKYGDFDEEQGFLLSVIKTVESWGQVLKQGVSQERIRQGLDELSALLRFRGERAKSSLCVELSKNLEQTLDGIITMGKLRHFLCFATERLWGVNEEVII